MLRQSVQFARKFWHLPTTGLGWVGLAGDTFNEYGLQRRKKKWQAANQGFEHFDAFEMGKGAGLLITAWVTHQREASISEHLARLEALVQALDETVHTPSEKAFYRYLASKIALTLEGYHSKLNEPQARYQVYQTQAKKLLSTMPLGASQKSGYRKPEQGDIFTGSPFHPETLFSVAHRFLSASCVEKDAHALDVFLSGWQGKPLKSAAHHYAQLFALTHLSQATESYGETFGSVLDQWFESYRQYQIQEIECQQKYLKQGISMVSGSWFGNQFLSRFPGIFSGKR